MASEKINPPWDPETVDNLNEFQKRGAMHPFTCPRREEIDHDDEGLLTAFPEGWLCWQCGYRQYWAHAFMADRGWLKP